MRRDRQILDSVQMTECMMDIMYNLDIQLFATLGNRVVYGPFQGMTINPTPHWFDGNAGTKLLGCYEFELFGVIAKILERKPKTIINIGCAEGYYAVGLAKLLPEATVFAMDVEEKSLKECWEAARENDVSKRMEFHKGCQLASDLEIGGENRLYFMDCEGHEFELIDPVECPALLKSDIVVECHEFLRPGITEMLAERLKTTHEIWVIRPQLPPLDRYPFLAETPSVMNILAVTEKRPMPTRWLACWAH